MCDRELNGSHDHRIAEQNVTTSDTTSNVSIFRLLSSWNIVVGRVAITISFGAFMHFEFTIDVLVR